MAESPVPTTDVICQACSFGAMTLAIELKAARIYVCHGCGASLSVCIDGNRRKPKAPYHISRRQPPR